MKQEVEFVCANSEYPRYQDRLSKHQKLFEKFKKKEGLIPYRQDFSNEKKQFAFAVVIENPDLLSYVEKEAEETGLPIDLIRSVPNWKITEIRKGIYPNQIKKLEKIV